MRGVGVMAAAALTAAAASAWAKPYPCKVTPEFRELDFWVGEWDVTDPSGKLVGRSSIQRIVGDCVVYENWFGTRGGTGKSFNFWDKLNHRWQQTWVDEDGDVQQFWGKVDGGALKYVAVDGTRRLTFSPLGGGRVRQLSEKTSDRGKTWTVEYDFTYAPRAAGAAATAK